MNDLDPYTDETLKEHNKFPIHFPPDLKGDNKPCLFRYTVTQQHAGETNLKVYQKWWVDHLLIQATEAGTSSASHLAKWKEIMYKDPVGKEDIPTTNSLCWKTVTRGRPIKTAFLLELERQQNECYIWMRGSLLRFTDTNAQVIIKRWVASQEAERNISRADRLKKGTRITWDQFKIVIIEQLCVETLGSYHMGALYKLMRTDNMLFHAWRGAVNTIVLNVKKHGKGWDKIVDKEAVHKLREWLTDQEIKAMSDHIIKLGKYTTYPSLKDICSKMTMDKFDETFANIAPENLPTKFTQSKMKDAIKRTLVSMGELMKEKAKSKEALAENARLKQQLAEANRDKNHYKKKADIIEKKAGKSSNNSQREQNRKDPNNDGVPIGKYGRCKAGCCQLCHNEVLKNRKHNGPCDAHKRREAALKMQKKRHEKDKDLDYNRGRKTPLEAYSSTDCEHCINEDVPAKYCKHPKDTCFRRPGGELDKLGIKGKSSAPRSLSSSSPSVKKTRRLSGTAKAKTTTLAPRTRLPPRRDIKLKRKLKSP